MPKEPLGFFKVPPNYSELSEEQQLAAAGVIADKIRDALLAQDAVSGDSDARAGAPDGVEGKRDDR
jgi:hypothetical protein